MLALTSAGRPVHLHRGTSVQLEYNSPLFDEDTILGTFAYSFAVPAPPNGPLYSYPERPDRAQEPGAPLPAELSESGVPLLVGTQRVRSASARQYSVAVAGGLSGAGLNERQLSSFEYGGLREVPRWVPIDPSDPASLLVPGLVPHANDVVAHPALYPYAFAPLRNEYLAPWQMLSSTAPDPLNYPLNTVNRWVVGAVASVGMPAGGTFTYNLDFTVPGGVNVLRYEPLPPYCPFPRLRYVLQAILEESGLVVDADQLLPGELGELVVVGNAQLVDRGDATTLRFALADVLPALTVGELLAALRQDLGIVVYVHRASGRVRSAYLVEAVAADAAYVDLSDCVAGGVETTVEEPQGLTLTSLVDGADELTKDWLTLQPDDSRVLAPVATAAALPASAVLLTDNPQTDQVRLVLDEEVYYRCTVAPSLDGVHVPLSWERLVPRLPVVPVNGGGEALAQRLAYVAELPTRIGSDPALTVPVPALKQPPFRAGAEGVGRSTVLRLLFYRGLQLASDGTTAYPSLSHQSPSGALSVRLAGAQGTYERLLSPWLAVKLRGTRYTVPLQLSPLGLATLEQATPVRLAGVRYLVRKLSATAPLRKPASAELVRL
ncbi:hypothetical protein MUN81_15445 [Hymenobacter sp. 5317J-9]|uniref:hypothetical protein n=1 Tax=Hymenobacter sp. 5317J-9 TaxID=2932250 RepID=UPI001FD68169|nr:hypothetical protein [Hymenobacter sp. 5317J-9]UOQ96630.1 hypothetical protein MUN81_15445 [Hymenobacter sp. 5317J-9]